MQFRHVVAVIAPRPAEAMFGGAFEGEHRI